MLKCDFMGVVLWRGASAINPPERRRLTLLLLFRHYLINIDNVNALIESFQVFLSYS